jgi:hypothetical protein
MSIFKVRSNNLVQKDKSIFHVFIIGSSANINNSNNFTEGQMPYESNLIDFINNTVQKKFKFYFIDPNHLDNSIDSQFFGQYDLYKIPFTVIYNKFNFDTFTSEYSIGDNDFVFFIDCSGELTQSEYDFITRYGSNENWFFITYKSNQRINLILCLQTAKQIPRYTIFKNMISPLLVTDSFKQSILDDLSRYLLYVKELPTNENSPLPYWCNDDINTKYKTFNELKELKYTALKNIIFFFSNNNFDITSIKENEWYEKAKSIIFRSLTLQN